MVSLYTNEDGTGDVALQLLEEGFLLAEHRREKRLQKLISEYKAAQNSAKKNRVCRRCRSSLKIGGHEVCLRGTHKHSISLRLKNTNSPSYQYSTALIGLH